MKRFRLSLLALLAALLAFSFNLSSARADDVPRDLQPALADASAHGKILLVDFSADWCPWCNKMDQSLQDPAVQQLINDHFHYLKLNVGNFDRHTGLLKANHITGIPYVMIFTPDGRILAAHSGYLPADQLKALLDQTLTQSGQ